LAVARDVHDACVERGVAAVCGGMLDTAVGRAANLALAALPGFTLTGDLSASTRWFPTDVAAPTLVDPDGCLAVPRGPGLGVVPRDETLAAYATARTWIRP
jgi:O-succinylbenzoate synthase